MIVSAISPRERPGPARVRGRLEGEQAGHALAVQGFDQRVEQLTGVPAPIPGYPGQTVDEDPARAHGRRLGQEHAVRFHDLLLEHAPRRGQDFQTTLRFQGAEVPAKLRGVADELLRRDLERHDDARLVKVVRAAIRKLEAEGGLSRPRGPGHDHHVAAREPSEQNVIQTGQFPCEEHRHSA